MIKNTLFTNFLFIIPARAGSKGIPGKNLKILGNKPLIYYSLDYARQFVEDDNICLTTDSEEIANCALQIGYKVPFIRPGNLATDTSRTYEVLIHAVEYYRKIGKKWDGIILLQPTSPFRKEEHLLEAINLYNVKIDMIVSVCESNYNPYYNLYEEDNFGILKISKGDGIYIRRQDIPPVFLLNGSIYIINPSSLFKNNSFRDFKIIKKYLMSNEYELDLDTPRDWEIAEILMNKVI